MTLPSGMTWSPRTATRAGWMPSWLAPDDGRIRDEYRAGHEPYHYLDACRRRDVRERIRARAAAWLRATRLLDP